MDGSWRWTEAPNGATQPIARCRHTSLLVGSVLMVAGGIAQDPEAEATMNIYDGEFQIWHSLPSFSRYSHSACLLDNCMFFCGGESQGDDQSFKQKMKIHKINIKNHFINRSSLLSELAQHKENLSIHSIHHGLQIYENHARARELVLNGIRQKYADHYSQISKKHAQQDHQVESELHLQLANYDKLEKEIK